jgi:23S rRNA (uridine2552-2'-O)-methyltransferase
MSRPWRDHFTDLARQMGYEARSVFKLAEIQRRTRIITRGCRVVDLGCYPGSWSRYLLEQGAGRLVGVDLVAPEKLPGGHFIVADALSVDPGALLEALGGPADLLVSDMAPSTSGNRNTDNARQVELAARALAIAVEVLRTGGGFVAKVFEGSEAPAFVEDVKARFEHTRRFKPEATRKHSIEFFVVGSGFLGRIG